MQYFLLVISVLSVLPVSLCRRGGGSGGGGTSSGSGPSLNLNLEEDELTFFIVDIVIGFLFLLSLIYAMVLSSRRSSTSYKPSFVMTVLASFLLMVSFALGAGAVVAYSLDSIQRLSFLELGQLTVVPTLEFFTQNLSFVILAAAALLLVNMRLKSAERAQQIGSRTVIKILRGTFIAFVLLAVAVEIVRAALSDASRKQIYGAIDNLDDSLDNASLGIFHLQRALHSVLAILVATFSALVHTRLRKFGIKDKITARVLQVVSPALLLWSLFDIADDILVSVDEDPSFDLFAYSIAYTVILALLHLWAIIALLVLSSKARLDLIAGKTGYAA